MSQSTGTHGIWEMHESARTGAIRAMATLLEHRPSPKPYAPMSEAEARRIGRPPRALCEEVVADLVARTTDVHS
jgi:hypothetical protein